MFLYALVRLILGIIYCIPPLLVLFLSCNLLHEYGFITGSTVFVFSALISVVLSVIMIVVISKLKSEATRLYDTELFFWGPAASDQRYYSRGKVILWMFPTYFLTAILAAAAIYLYLEYVQGLENVLDVEITDGGFKGLLLAEVLVGVIGAAIFFTLYSFYLIVWCFRAACPECKNVMTLKHEFNSDEKTHTEYGATKTRSTKVGTARVDGHSVDVYQDVSYSKEYEVRTWVEHCCCIACNSWVMGNKKSKKKKQDS